MEKKTWKRIAALGTGALMLGATLTSALALADLSAYPEPFVTNGVLDVTDTVIVLGEAAPAADVLGAVDVAASLQAAAVTEVEVGSTVIDPTVADGVKVEKSGNKLNYNDDLQDLQDVYDDSELPDLLGGGYLKGKKYEESLTLTTGSGVVKYASPGKVDKIEFDAGNYLYFPTSTGVYTYALTMESTLNEEAADLEGKSFDLQGRTYTISDITYSSTTGGYTDMTLMAGSTTTNLNQDVPLTVGEKTVTLVSVNEGGTTCLVSVDGVTKQVDVGDNEAVNGLSIGVLNAFYADTVKTCEVTLGADKLVLNNGGKIERNGEDIDGTAVTLTGNNTASTFDSISIVYSADKDDWENFGNTYTQYYAEGDSWVDPVFGNFQFLFGGMSSKTEVLNLERSGDEATLTFKNTKGDEVVVDYYMSAAARATPTDKSTTYGTDGTTITPGDTTSGPILFQAGTTAVIQNVSNVSTTTFPDVKLWYVLNGGELHLLEFDEFDEDNNKLTFEDLTSGSSVKTSALSAVAGALESVTLGSLGSIQLGYNSASTELLFNATANVAETMYGGEIALSTTNGTLFTLVSPTEDSDEAQSGDETFTVAATFDTTDDEIDLSAPTTSGTFHASAVNKEYNDNDVQMFVSTKGVVFEYDADGDSSLMVTYPEEDVYANVFVSPAGLAALGGGSTGGSDAYVVNSVGVKLAVLDSEAGSMNKNMIVVGGPCANTVAAELMGNPDNCAEGFEEGKAMLQFFDRNGKSALLVAGATADDTRGAAYVLAKYADYGLSGDAVEVVSADLSNLQVNTV
jgi:hypothetical protein